MTLDPGQAIVVFDPVRVTPEQLARAVNGKTPFDAKVLAVAEAAKK